MRARARLLLVLASSACQGERAPPLAATPPLYVSAQDEQPTLVLDERTVPQVSECAPGQVVVRADPGWACAGVNDGTAALRAELERLAARVNALERGPTYFIAARACQPEDPDRNLVWSADCAHHAGTTATPVVLHCPVAVTASRENAASDGRPRWTRISLYGVDQSAPPESSTAVLELYSLGAGGAAAGFQAVAGTRVAVDGVASPSTSSFSGVGLDRLIEARVTLRTLAPNTPSPASFCGFGLGPT